MINKRELSTGMNCSEWIGGTQFTALGQSASTRSQFGRRHKSQILQFKQLQKLSQDYFSVRASSMNMDGESN